MTRRLLPAALALLIALPAQAQRIDDLQTRLDAAVRRRVETARGEVARLAATTTALSPLSVLARGYAVAHGPGGEVLRDPTQVRPGDAIDVRLSGGTVRAEVLAS